MTHNFSFVTLLLVIVFLRTSLTMQSRSKNSNAVYIDPFAPKVDTKNEHQFTNSSKVFKQASKTVQYLNTETDADNPITEVFNEENSETKKLRSVEANFSSGNFYKKLDDYISVKSIKRNSEELKSEKIGSSFSDLNELKNDRRAREGSTLKVTKPEDKPYSVMILLEASMGPGVCSGSLITLDWVLSAAICFMDKPISSIKIYAGGYSLAELMNKKFAKGSQVLKGIHSYSHPWFYLDGFKSYYNLALVKAAKKFQSTNTVGTIQISLKPWIFNDYQPCEITSFGRIQLLDNRTLDYLRKTYLWQVRSPCDCLERDRKPDKWLCAEPLEELGVCHGDMGAGLVCDGTVRAVATLILPVRKFISCNSNTNSFECGWNNTKNIFQNICHGLKWINTHVKLFKQEELPQVCGISADLVTANKQSRLTILPPFSFIFYLQIILLLTHRLCFFSHIC